MKTASEFEPELQFFTAITCDRSAADDPCVNAVHLWGAYELKCSTGTSLIVLACHHDFFKLRDDEFEAELVTAKHELKHAIESRINKGMKRQSRYLIHPSNTIWLLNFPDGSYYLMRNGIDESDGLYHIKLEPFPSIDSKVPAGSYQALAKVFSREARYVKEQLNRKFWSQI